MSLGRNNLPMSSLFAGLQRLPGYGIGAVILILLYMIQTEIRYGQRARAMHAGSADRKSTLALSLCALVPVFGFVLAMKASFASTTNLPQWFRGAMLPGEPVTGWIGVIVGATGIALRLWAVLTLRERYTRTLLMQEEHTIERGGPYRWLRHPGYLGSLMVLNGIALASGNWITLLASLIATLGAYTYRIKVEDEMLLAAFGEPYSKYRREVGGLIPSLRPARTARDKTAT